MACSTKENTARNRFFHSFTARYNIYYNGIVAYDEGCLAKEIGNKDNYTEILPLFIVGNKTSQELGKANFETSITKCEKAIKLHSIKRKPVTRSNKRRTPKQKEYLARKEFNPFLKKAWILMGKSQFQKGDFLEAASTFSYITRLYATEKEVLQEARTWLARCYVEQEWFYDAEDVLNKFRRDSLFHSSQASYDATMADFYLRQQRFAEALPFLKRVVKKEHRKKLKARGYFLLGQIHANLGQRQEAYKAFQKTLRQNPPYQLEFNARIQQTEVLSDGKGKNMISRLKRMAKSPNNKDYLDQVFYAIGNIYIAQGDTANAISAYEEGGSKSTRNSIEKGVLMLKLGNIYWAKKKFADAQRSYRTAIGLIEKETTEYKMIDHRSQVLDELVPFTEAIYLQDSLQSLANMPEKQRFEAIDRVIANLIAKEKAAKRASADSLADATAGNTNGMGTSMTQPPTNTNTSMSNSTAWYFYNPQAVMQGKTEFLRQWGQRKNEDDWRRSNKSVLANNSFEETSYDEPEDSVASESKEDSVTLEKDKKKEVKDSISSDPHTREFYLAQIPLTENQKAESDKIIKEALFKAGVIEKDKLEDYVLSKQTLNRLLTQYTDFSPMDEVLYHLFLIESRWGTSQGADEYRAALAANYQESEYTKLITAPDYESNARFGKHLEDSLYVATYNAYRSGNISTMAANCQISADKYPNGANRSKFMFFDAMSKLLEHDRKQSLEILKALVKAYPKDDISELAGLIAKGIESGRAIGRGGYDISSLWSRRTAFANAETDSAMNKASLTAERNTGFVFVFAYPADSINEDQLLFELARYNFSSFMVRNFDIQTISDGILHQMLVSGFTNYDEAHSYVQKLTQTSNFASILRKGRIVLISQDNLKLLGTEYSFDEYKAFFEKNFAPVKIKPDLLLDEQREEFAVPEDNVPGEEIKTDENKDSDAGNTEDAGEWYSE